MIYSNKLNTLLLSGMFSLFLIFGSSCKGDEIELDFCEPITCQNGGACDQGICGCLSGYEGQFCEIESRSLYYGDYAMIAGDEDCEDVTVLGQTQDPTQLIPATDDYTLSITGDPLNIFGLILTNTDDPSLFTATATIDDGVITIADQDVGEQTVQGNVITVSASGSGSLSGNNITLNLTKTRTVSITIPVIGAQTVQAVCTQVQNGVK